MSLVPTYVLADDNEFYKDPTISGSDFFICFDDDDPPELVIMTGVEDIESMDDIDFDAMQKRAKEILESLNISATLNGVGYSCGRVFDDDPLSADFKPAYAVFIDINKRIPVSVITQHEGLYEGYGECVFETFEKDFDLHKWKKNKFGKGD